MSASPDKHERPAMELETAIDGLVLRDLELSDAPTWIGLVLRNREHLTEFGEEHLPPHTVEDVTAWLANRFRRDFQPGIWLDGELIGHVLVSHLSYARGDTEAILAESPNAFSLGYWISAEHTGKGYVTEACLALMDYVRAECDATDFHSGARPGNQKSERVLERLGLTLTKATDTYVSYRLTDC